MLLFIAGMLAGAVVSLMILGFLAVVAEDHEQEEQARKKNQKAMDLYMEDDGR